MFILEILSFADFTGLDPNCTGSLGSLTDVDHFHSIKFHFC